MQRKDLSFSTWTSSSRRRNVIASQQLASNEEFMTHFKLLLATANSVGTTLLALALMSPTTQSSAQTVAIRTLCTSHGPNVNEAMPDREGQTVLVADATCIIQGGPMDGAIETQQNVWHFDKAAGTLVSSHGVSRKPGSMAVYLNRTGTLTFQMTEGKVTGWTSSGTGRYPLGAGAATSLAGKSYTWTASPTGPRSYAVSLVIDQ
jgi:hypothetical protein